MAKVSGVDKQEYLRRLYGTAITEIDNYVKDAVDNYKAMIAEYEEQSKVGFLGLGFAYYLATIYHYSWDA